VKKILFIVGFCIFICTNLFADNIDIHLQNYYKLQQSAVSLTTYCSNSKVYVCSGIIIKEDNNSTGILTAKHCIVPKIKKIVINDKYVSFKFKRAKDIDVAYIELNHSLLRYNPVKISNYNANKLDYVYFLGYPNKEMFEIGIILWNGIKEQTTVMNSIPGCSGSGVVNQKGELIGILWGSYNIDFFNKKTHIAGITPIELIKPFLIKLKIWNKLRFE